MDTQINQMVAGDVKFPEMVVEGQGQYTDIPARQGVISGKTAEVIDQFLNIGIKSDPEMVIEDKGDMEGIGINYDAGEQDKEDGGN